MNWRQPKPLLQSLKKTPKGKCILSMRQSLQIVLPSLCSSQHLFPAKQLFQKHSALFSIISHGNPSTWLFTHSPPSRLASAHPPSASLSLPPSPEISGLAPFVQGFPIPGRLQSASLRARAKKTLLDIFLEGNYLKFSQAEKF